MIIDTSKCNDTEIELKKNLLLDDDFMSYCDNCDLSADKSCCDNSKKSGRWSIEEDEMLIQQVKLHGNKNWKKIADNMGCRTPVQCLHRWTKILKPGLKKGSWTIEEDRKLLEWIKTEGAAKWSQCAEFITGRSGKQCRERWFNTLNPEVKKGNWTPEEDYVIFQQFSNSGSKWSKIAQSLPGRTENSIKNRFYSTLRRIAAESRKTCRVGKSSYDLMSECSAASSSLNDLLKYFPSALEEKTKCYQTLNELHKDLGNNSNIVKDLLPNSISLQHEKKAKVLKNNPLQMGMLNKKTNRSSSCNPFKQPNTTNIHNTFNFNLNLMEKYAQRKESAEQLEDAIDSFNCENMKMPEQKIEKLESKINSLICNYKEINCSKKTQKEVAGMGESSLNDLLSQLNELEEILHNTKKEIYEFEKIKISNSKELEMFNNPKAVVENNNQKVSSPCDGFQSNNNQCQNVNNPTVNGMSNYFNGIQTFQSKGMTYDNNNNNNNSLFFQHGEDSSALYSENIFKF